MADYTKSYEMGGIALEWAHIPTAGATGDSIRFKAFITTFNESYQSDWNQEHVYGRMDPIESFRSTRRTISLGWTVIAHSPQEGSENLSKVSKLLKFLYPTYALQQKSFNESGFGVISASPLLKLKFMNLIQNAPRGATAATSIANAFSSDSQQSYGSVLTSGLVGRVDGFNVNHELDDGFFMGDGPTATPKRISLSCNFYPIHEHGLGWDGNTKQFFAPEWPYGKSEGLSSMGAVGTNQVDLEKSATIAQTPAVDVADAQNQVADASGITGAA